jgi:hypothetical protein
MATKALKALWRAENEGRMVTCWVNVSFTSEITKAYFHSLQSFFYTYIYIHTYFYKVCWRCKKQSNTLNEVEDAFSGGRMSLWGVLECTICGHNWDRDVNAANSIRYLEYDGLDRPEVFRRRTEDGTDNLQTLFNLMEIDAQVASSL